MPTEKWFQSPICGADAQSYRNRSWRSIRSGFQSPICGADAQSQLLLDHQLLFLGFNPLFAGLTLKVWAVAR